MEKLIVFPLRLGARMDASIVCTVNNGIQHFSRRNGDDRYFLVWNADSEIRPNLVCCDWSWARKYTVVCFAIGHYINVVRHCEIFAKLMCLVFESNHREEAEHRELIDASSGRIWHLLCLSYATCLKCLVICDSEFINFFVERDYAYYPIYGRGWDYPTYWLNIRLSIQGTSASINQKSSILKLSLDKAYEFLYKRIVPW